MAEGLEEESKKSLRMGAELEKQTALSQQLKVNLSKQEKKYVVVWYFARLRISIEYDVFVFNMHIYFVTFLMKFFSLRCLFLDLMTWK